MVLASQQRVKCTVLVYMAGEGAILEMIKTLKFNKGQLRKRRFSNNKDLYSRALNRKKLVFKEATSEQSNEIRIELQKKNAKQQKFLFLAVVFSLLVCSLVLYWLMNNENMPLFFS